MLNLSLEVAGIILKMSRNSFCFAANDSSHLPVRFLPPSVLERLHAKEVVLLRVFGVLCEKQVGVRLYNARKCYIRSGETGSPGDYR